MQRQDWFPQEKVKQEKTKRTDRAKSPNNIDLDPVCTDVIVEIPEELMES